MVTIEEENRYFKRVLSFCQERKNKTFGDMEGNAT